MRLSNPIVVDGVPIRFERRGYGRGVIYTWAYAEIEGESHLLGDPWPCIRPKTNEIQEALGYLLQELREEK